MENSNKSLRIRTSVGLDEYITVNLDSDYDVLEILSLKINQKGNYRYHTSTYGVLVGRVLANNGFGIPNAKLSLFIPRGENDDILETVLYPYTSINTKDSNGVRYNLLPSEKGDACHQAIGTMHSKRVLLDNDSVMEIFDKYYLYTTRTNEAGDYMFFGVPTGSYQLHMDLDISDCGRLSQRPRDLIYKGYNIDNFDTPTKFKTDTEIDTLTQVFTEDVTVDIKPFWGDVNEGTQIGIVRHDINVRYTFEPTCVFMGSIISDSPNEGVSLKCVPSKRMGEMGEMETGTGTIEIIRKKIDNTVEDLVIHGTNLIDGNGVWCFQIPMNLDYIMTDEYGNTVPSDDPQKGIPTRCEVRFRISMDETLTETATYQRGKILVPHNPQKESEIDYVFGSETKDTSFKSLMWNNVYSIKSFIPRFQKTVKFKSEKFTGIKKVNVNKGNNPMPYNNIRIDIPFMFWFLCSAIKIFVNLVQMFNELKMALMYNLGKFGLVLPWSYLSNNLCPDMQYWYFAPGMNVNKNNLSFLRVLKNWFSKKDGEDCKTWEQKSVKKTFVKIAKDIKQTDDADVNQDSVVCVYVGLGNEDKSQMISEDELEAIITKGRPIDMTDKTFTDIDDLKDKVKDVDDEYTKGGNWVKIIVSDSAVLDGASNEVKNALTDIDDATIKLTPNIDYLMQCIEMNLAQEYEVIKFDFYNDWINGTIYLPRWMRNVKYRKKRKRGKEEIKVKAKGCINNYENGFTARRYVQFCSLNYDENDNISENMPNGCAASGKQNCHLLEGTDSIAILGNGSGIVHEQKTILNEDVYYMKPKEFKKHLEFGIPLFATDIIMLGTLFDCNEYGLPSTFEYLKSTTYNMPPNMAATNTDDDVYTYNGSSKDGLPTVKDVLSWGKHHCAIGNLVTGVTSTIPSYKEILKTLKDERNYDGTTANVLEYEDIFPVTEISGIDWGYTGPDQAEPSSDDLFSPGGHFMGLACTNGKTNIKSCVNLKRACEIGVDLSARYEIPIGVRQSDNGDPEKVMYLYVSPSGLISKDQVTDVTFRSAFATMNQNSLETVTDNVTLHKRYNFRYLLPDSFDGCMATKIKDDVAQKYNQRLNLKWDTYWDEVENKDELLGLDVQLEQGYTVHRTIEARSNDYLSFRNKDSQYLRTIGAFKSMPVYSNSFYFYFGLKRGFTALDKFKREYFSVCK